MRMPSRLAALSSRKTPDAPQSNGDGGLPGRRPGSAPPRSPRRWPPPGRRAGHRGRPTDDVVLHEGVAADDHVRAQLQAAERRHEAVEILRAPQVEPGPDVGNHQPPARAVVLRERPGELTGTSASAMGAMSGGRHQVAGDPAIGVGHRRQRRLGQQPADVRQQRAACRPDRGGPDRPASSRARTGARLAGRRRRRACRSATSRARSRVGSAITVPPEMPRPNARSMVSFQRRVSASSGAARAQVLEVGLERAAGQIRPRRRPRPTTATSTVSTTPAAGGAPAPPDRAEPRRRAPLPAIRRASSAASAAGKTRNVAAQQQQDPDAADHARSGGSRESASPAARRRRPTRSAPRPAFRRSCPATAAPSAATASGRRAALLEVARQQDDAEVDAVAHDDRGQERRRQVQVADAQAGERERRQRAQRQRAQQRADGRARRRRRAASRARRSRS